MGDKRGRDDRDAYYGGGGGGRGYGGGGGGGYPGGGRGGYDDGRGGYGGGGGGYGGGDRGGGGGGFGGRGGGHGGGRGGGPQTPFYERGSTVQLLTSTHVLMPPDNFRELTCPYLYNVRTHLLVPAESEAAAQHAAAIAAAAAAGGGEMVPAGGAGGWDPLPPGYVLVPSPFVNEAEVHPLATRAARRLGLPDDAVLRMLLIAGGAHFPVPLRGDVGFDLSRRRVLLDPREGADEDVRVVVDFLPSRVVQPDDPDFEVMRTQQTSRLAGMVHAFTRRAVRDTAATAGGGVAAMGGAITSVGTGGGAAALAPGVAPRRIDVPGPHGGGAIVVAPQVRVSLSTQARGAGLPAVDMVNFEPGARVMQAATCMDVLRGIFGGRPYDHPAARTAFEAEMANRLVVTSHTRGGSATVTYRVVRVAWELHPGSPLSLGVSRVRAAGVLQDALARAQQGHGGGGGGPHGALAQLQAAPAGAALALAGIGAADVAALQAAAAAPAMAPPVQWQTTYGAYFLTVHGVRLRQLSGVGPLLEVEPDGRPRRGGAGGGGGGARRQFLPPELCRMRGYTTEQKANVALKRAVLEATQWGAQCDSVLGRSVAGMMATALARSGHTLSAPVVVAGVLSGPSTVLPAGGGGAHGGRALGVDAATGEFTMPQQVRPAVDPGVGGKLALPHGAGAGAGGGGGRNGGNWALVVPRKNERQQHGWVDSLIAMARQKGISLGAPLRVSAIDGADIRACLRTQPPVALTIIVLPGAKGDAEGTRWKAAAKAEEDANPRVGALQCVTAATMERQRNETPLKNMLLQAVVRLDCDLWITHEAWATLSQLTALLRLSDDDAAAAAAPQLLPPPPFSASMELALSSSNHGGGAGAGGLRVMRPFCFAALHVADGVAVLAFTTSPHLTGLRYVAVEHTTDPNAPAPVEALVTAMLAVWRQPEVAAKWAGAPVTPTRGPLAPSLVFFYRPLTAARHFVDAANHAEGPFINPDLDTSEVAQLDRALAAGAAAVGGGVARQPVARAYIIVDQDSGTRLYRSGDVGKAAGTFLVVPLLPPTEEGADDGVNVLDVGPHSQQLPAVFNPPVGTVVVSQVAKEPHDADGEKLWLSFLLTTVLPRHGTAKPTQYSVIPSKALRELEGEDLLAAVSTVQEATKAACFLYANWLGPIKVPHVCQHAMKTAKRLGVTKPDFAGYNDPRRAVNRFVSI